MQAVLPPQIWRKSYLYKLRYHLRGNDPLFVDDCIRMIDGHIEDAVTEAMAGVCAPSSSDAQHYRGLERAVVQALASPEEMAAQFRRAWAEKTFADFDALIWDGLTFVLAAVLATSTASDSRLPVVVPHVVGYVAALGTLSSSVLRRLPVGRRARLVHWAMRWTRRSTAWAAVATGTTGVSGFFALAISSHGITLAVSFDHLPVKLVAIGLCALLASQPRLLRKSEGWLRRYIDLKAYRRDINSEWEANERRRYEQWLEDQRTFGYFTER
jgi:hypothetical protein